ncbi:hypothetical protein Srubr_44970 [Streptomyces rubradiris]|uniref:Tyr recombinase domain-containing protein n=1 Tax=Streptomyces rubradiris TaxID=285531 RepID=A0ABQ3RFP2_STRRR|nr:hypothetical protein GCM10018792_07300 [Streptomyces rubradiris]GHI54651.1 hypothetical protein Srubr_44970 [Streptomyces rubradiris]
MEIPSEQQGLDLLDVVREEPVRNRVMLALAYDAALRREELCSLRARGHRSCSPDAADQGGDDEVPSRAHGKSCGSSRQAQPARTQYANASINSRRECLGGRPPGVGGGTSGSSTTHSASERSLG